VLEQRRTGDDDALPATTDAKGRFAIADLAPGRYDLEARASGFATARVPGVSVREDVPSTEIGSIALSPGVAIEGVVRDADGVPLEGVEIHMQDEGGVLGILRAGTLAERSADTTSNADGRFRLEDLADGAIVTVRAKLEGYSTTGVEGVRAPTDEPLELRMERAATLRGVVVDHLGEGVESAEVRLTPESRSARIDLGDITSIVRNEHADREGRFAIANVVSGRYELRASASGFQETRQTGIEVTAERDPAELRLVLERGAALHGQVLGDDGNPVLGASVQRVVQRRSPLDFWAGPNDATSGADGRYRLEGLPTGQSTFSAEHERFPKQVRDFVVQPGENLLDFRLEAGRTISGRVVDDTGLPIAGASVSVRAPTGGIAFSAGGQADPLTDEGGQFTIEGLADGVYHVVAHKAGFADATTEVPMRLDGSSVHGIELQLSTGAALVGKVLGLDFDELANVQLIAMQMGGLQMGSAANPRLGVVDYEGRYRLENLAVGDWILVATVGQGRRSVREMVTVEPGAEEVVRDLDFGGGQAIRGRVVRNGEPVRGVAIFAVGTSTGNGSHGATDQDGRFALLNLESDTYRLVVASLAGVPSHEEEVELAGADAEVLIELREAAIAGRVVDASDRAPVAGAAITVVAVDEDSLVRGFGGFGGLGTPPHSTADGSFRIGGFSPGTWLVRAEKEGYAAGTAQIEIGESADALAVEIELEPASGLTLIVTSPFGRPVNEVFVAALDAGERSVLHGQYSAGEGGVVRLDELPAGSWTLLVTSGGSATASIAVESPGAAVPVRLPEAGILQVRVTELEGTGLQASARLLDAAGRAYRSALFFQTMTKWPLFDGVGTIPQVPAGTWTLEVSTPDGERTWSRVVSVLPGTTLDVIID
jgi:uncharacterized GH25 family protein